MCMNTNKIKSTYTAYFINIFKESGFVGINIYLKRLISINLCIHIYYITIYYIIYWCCYLVVLVISALY